MVKQLQEELRKHLAASDQFRTKYDGKAQDMTPDDEQRWDSAINEADRIQGLIEKAQKAESQSQWADKIHETLPVLVAQAEKGTDENSKMLKATANLFRFGARDLPNDDKQFLAAYQSSDMGGGGYTVLPMQLVNTLLTKVKDLTFVRGMATVIGVDKAESLGVPSIDTDPSDSDWTAELLTGSLESTMVYGRRDLTPHPLAKRIKISDKLIRQSGQDVIGVVLDRLAYKMAVAQEKAFLTGHGVNQPLGVFTATANGISTSADTTAAGASSVAADDLVNVKHDLKLAYWPNASWILSRTVLKSVRKLKDDQNNYIWATGMGPGMGYQGNPQTLLDQPYHVSEFAPGTLTTGLYVAILGDFRQYYIADALNMRVQVLNELYAETNQIGYILRCEVDGMPVQEEAFRRLKLA